MNKIRLFTALVLLIGGLVAMMSTLHAAEKGEAHWTYKGEEGPDHWGELIDVRFNIFDNKSNNSLSTGISSSEFHEFLKSIA